MRAIALFSGGLDSMLAVRMMVDQGIEVIALTIDIGFGGGREAEPILRRRAEMAGACFRYIDGRQTYLDEILFDPVYGYGKQHNPCIDCHGFMLRIAKGVMVQERACFIVTGEVLGQRPMSQLSDRMERVMELAGETQTRRVLRPLSARLMPLSLPETEGWVDRDRLEAIHGRGRKRQIALARTHGWEDYASPGGGCLLTDAGYSARLREHIRFARPSLSAITLLRHGRHFRLPTGVKLIVGRDRKDNETLMRVKPDDYLALIAPAPAPYALLHRDADIQTRHLAAQIVATYAKKPAGTFCEVRIEAQSLSVLPFSNLHEARDYLIGK
jgi:tRNA-uridine 2-sulfurtransferase